MKKIITIICSFLILTATGQDYKTLIKNVPGMDKFPDASTINVFTKIDITVNNDGSYAKHIYFIKKILNYKGKKQYSDYNITYNANFEKVVIGNCFSVRDEKEIPLPKEATHDNGTYTTMTSPEYINERATVINLPAVEPNDFIVLDYTINGKSRSFFSGVEDFQEENPYLHKELTITVPKSLTLNYRFNETKIKLAKSVSGDNNVYKWSADNTPLIKDENNKPSFWVIGMPVFYSTQASWKDAIPFLFKQFKSVSYETDNIKKLMPELASSKVTNEVKLHKIYSYIKTNFICKSDMSDDDYVPQTPEKLLEQHYGSSRELTALFIAMAKFAGVEVKPVFALSETHIKEIKDIPCRDFIDGIYAYYKNTIIDLSTKDAPFGFAKIEKAYLITDDSPANIINYQFDNKDMVKSEVTIHLNDDLTAKAEFNKEYRGVEDYNIRSQFKDETDKNRKIWFTSNIDDKSITVSAGPEFIDIQNLESNLKIKFTAHIDDYYTKQDSYLYMKLPESKKISIQLNGKERETPYQISNTISVTEKYVFDNLMKEYSVIKPQEKIEKTFKTADGDMYFSITAVVENGKLAVYRKIFIPQTIIPKENYPAFYQFISSIQNPLNTVVFLKK